MEVQSNMTPAEKFFYDNAGWSYDPTKETSEQGRQSCARALASAEAEARDAGLSFDWSQDHITNRDFTDDGPEYYLWSCVCRDESGEVCASLGGVDFGHTGDDDDEFAEAKQPWGDPYRRVVEAELALEAFATA